MSHQEEKKKSTTDDEIDFELLLKNIQKQQQKFLHRIVLLKRKWKMIVLSTTLGVLLGFVLFQSIPAIYQAEMSLTNAGQPNVILFERIHALNQLADDGEISALSKLLETTEEIASTISQVEYLNIDRNVNTEDSIPSNYFFIVQLKIYDNQHLDQLQTSIIRYLEASEFLGKKKSIRIENVKSQIKNLENNLVEVDSLKNTIIASLIPRANSQGIIYGEAPDQVNVIKKGIELYNNKLLLENDLKLVDIEVVNEFVPNNKPISPKKLYFIGMGLVLGFIVALLIPGPKSS